MLSRKRSISLSTVLILTTVIMTVLPSMVFGFLAMGLVEDIFIQQLDQASVHAANANAGMLVQSLSGPALQLERFRDIVQQSPRPAEAFKAYSWTVASAGVFRRVELTDAGGILVANWPENPGRIGTVVGIAPAEPGTANGSAYGLSDGYISFDDGSFVADMRIRCGSGLLSGTLDLSRVRSVFTGQKAVDGIRICLLDGQGNVLSEAGAPLSAEAQAQLGALARSTPDAGTPKAAETIRLEGVEYLPVREPVPGSGWTLTYLAPMAPLQETLQMMRIGIVVILGVLLVVGQAVLYLINSRVRSQIRQVLAFTERVSAGRYAYLLPPRMFGEMETLLDHFEEMAKVVEQREREISEKNRNMLLMNARLEEHVEHRTRQLFTTNRDLERTLHELQETQEQLIQSERMANLGHLVAGVAHEINTPIGIGHTTITYQEQLLRELQERYQESRLRKSEMDEYLHKCLECARIVTVNLQNAAELIRSFKMIAVDQSYGELREIPVLEYLEDIVLSLKPQLRHHEVRIRVSPETLTYICYPGDFSQVVGNLLNNAVIHGFSEGGPGKIELTAELQQDRIHLTVADDGVGIPQENLRRIYEPFFTTRRGSGGTGLGLNIVYNIVTQKFGGTVLCESAPGEGARFTLIFPVTSASDCSGQESMVE